MDKHPPELVAGFRVEGLEKRRDIGVLEHSITLRRFDCQRPGIPAPPNVRDRAGASRGTPPKPRAQNELQTDAKRPRRVWAFFARKQEGSDTSLGHHRARPAGVTSAFRAASLRSKTRDVKAGQAGQDCRTAGDNQPFSCAWPVLFLPATRPISAAGRSTLSALRASSSARSSAANDNTATLAHRSRRTSLDGSGHKARAQAAAQSPQGDDVSVFALITVSAESATYTSMPGPPFTVSPPRPSRVSRQRSSPIPPAM